MEIQTKQKKIKVGDKVRIITPEFFVRCGYENTIDVQTQNVLDKHTKDINALIAAANTQPGCRIYVEKFERLRNQIARCIAYEWVGRTSRTGAERKIFTERREDMEGREVAVTKIKCVKTGIYQAGQGWSEDDYDPAWLKDEKTHRILQIWWGFWIEEKNVERV